VRHLTAEEVLAVETTSAGNKLSLERLIVRGLLSFGEEAVFEFGRLNILIGPNGSGKSNLIDCLRVLRHSPFNIQDAFADSGFEGWVFRGSADRRTAKAYMEATVWLPETPNSVRHQLSLGPAIHSRAQIEEVIRDSQAEPDEDVPFFIGSPRGLAVLSVPGTRARRRERELRPGEYDPFQSILSRVRDVEQFPEITRLATLYSSFRIYSEWTFGRNSTLRQPTSAGRSDVRLSENMDDLALTLNALERSPAHEQIRVLLRELKETYRDYVTRILFGRVGLELLEAPFEEPLPATRLSDGTLRFLALAAILLQPDPPPLICLEEPELGMHPDMVRMVGRLIVQASSKAQIIVSTHSEQLLSVLQDDFDALFAFDGGATGSAVRRFSREQFRNWEAEHTLGELWSSGELGGNRW
jgi:predicted ATPase